MMMKGTLEIVRDQTPSHYNLLFLVERALGRMEISH